MIQIRKLCYFSFYFLLIFFYYNPSPIHTEEKDKIPNKILEDKKLTLLGKILAGLQKPDFNSDDEKLNQILQSSVYKNHYKQMQISWEKTEEIRLQKMRKWVESELSFLCEKKNVIFYPFSGPDVLNVQILFPCAKEYILFGLEPPGEIREIENFNYRELQLYLSYIQSSLYSILNYSFFRTNDMKIDFFKKLDGIAPILLTFLAYNQNKIIRITKITLTNEDTIIENKFDHGIPGVRIYFVDHKNHQNIIKSILYFQIDVSNGNLQKNGYFLDHITKHSPFFTFIKAASYLMHNNQFSRIREFILNQSDFILQDDSGIPLKYFSNEKWNLVFYGNYTTPIPLFRNKFQKDLREIYLNKKNIQPLPFGTGYHFYPGTSNLMMALDKTAF
ncbi:MAG: hypothetical protein ACK4UJ_05780 [Leptonema sp. (in: bacteria)]